MVWSRSATINYDYIKKTGTVLGAIDRTIVTNAGTGTETYSFSGSMANGVLTGTLSESARANPSRRDTTSGASSAPVTLREAAPAPS